MMKLRENGAVIVDQQRLAAAIVAAVLGDIKQSEKQFIDELFIALEGKVEKTFGKRPGGYGWVRALKRRERSGHGAPLYILATEWGRGYCKTWMGVQMFWGDWSNPPEWTPINFEKLWDPEWL